MRSGSLAPEEETWGTGATRRSLKMKAARIPVATYAHPTGAFPGDKWNSRTKAGGTSVAHQSSGILIQPWRIA